MNKESTSLIHSKKYIIKIIASNEELEAIYLSKYINLFNEAFKDVFIADNGNIYTINQIAL